MKAEEPYVGKPLVRFREGRGGNWLHREHPVYSTPLPAVALNGSKRAGASHPSRPREC
jgi:hypothetical protein